MVLADVDRLLGEGDYGAAKTKIETALGDPALAASKEVLLAAAKLAGSFADRRARMRRRMEAEVGQEVKVLTASGLRKGELQEASEAGLVLVAKSIINGRVMGTREFTVPWGDLAPKEQDRLAEGWPTEEADGQIALAAIALMRGDGEAAEQALVIAGDHPLVPHYRARLVAISAGAADRAAEAAWGRIETMAARELTADSARALLDEIDAFEEAHGNTRFAATAAGRIEAARGKAGGALGPVEGLVAHWSFDEVAGRAARDSTGRHHATVVGAAPAPGKTGKALAFDGRASYVELPAAATSGLKEFSFSFWVKTTEGRQSEVYWQRPSMLGQATKGIPSGDMSVGSNGGYISIYHGQDKKDRAHLSTTTKIGDGQWHHVTVTRDGSFMTLYVDAHVVTSLPARGPALNDTAFRVGAQGGREEAGYHTSGVIDDVRLYARALTAPEVCALAGVDPVDVEPDFRPGAPTVVSFKRTKARFVRVVIRESSLGAPGIDELEVYGSGGGRNLALAEGGAKPSASSCIKDYEIHKVANLNDGLYGNSHSWIAGGATDEWAQIELPRVAKVSSVVFSRDRTGVSRDRMPLHVEVQLSLDGQRWKTVREAKGKRTRDGG
ncbi:MAG: LamG-like jellyroll fold domain-containing protein [Planctomycetota bacterium]